MADDELALRRQTDRAAKAKALLDDPLLKEAFASVETTLTGLWRNSKPADNVGRERVWQMIDALDGARQFLAIAMTDGKVAQAQIDHIMKRKGKAA